MITEEPEYGRAVTQVRVGLDGFVGVSSQGKAYKRMKIYNKWSDYASAVVRDIYSDGLSLASHDLNLQLQNTRGFQEEMREIYAMTRKQGKTAKTAGTRAEYFRHHFARRISRLSKCSIRPDTALTTWWLGQYALEYKDTDINIRPLYAKGRRARLSLCRAMHLERNCRGINERPELTTQASKTEISLGVTNDRVYVIFNWYRMKMVEVHTLLGDFQSKQYTYDRPGKMRKLFRRLMPHADFTTMNSPQDLWQRDNNFFYIWASWPHSKFSWEQMSLFDRAVSKWVTPKITEYRIDNNE